MMSKRLFKKDDKAMSNLVPMVMTIIIAFAIISIGIFVIGMLGSNLEKQVGTRVSGKGQTQVMNFSFNRLNNTSRMWDSTMSIVNIAIIITVLAMAIGAIFLFTRQGGF